MRLAVMVLLVFLIGLCAEAAPNALPSGVQITPADVLAQMKEGGRSVQFQQVNMGPGQSKVFCHIYMVDKSYFLDLFRPDGTGALHRINEVELGDAPHSNVLDVSFMWLQPKHSHGPILLLHDRDLPGDWDGSWDVFVFPDGFEGRVVRQTFWEAVELGTSINPTFDLYDARGLLIITSWYGHETYVSGTLLYWNGHGFADRPARYLLIGPLFKTHAQVQAFLDSHDIQISENPYDKPPVYPSRYYKAKGLKPGWLVVVLGYFGFQKDADHAVEAMSEKGIVCSVLRLY